MLLTLLYAAATWVQAWRISSLRARVLQLAAQSGTVVLYKAPEVVPSDVEGGVCVQVPSVSSCLCTNSGSAKLGDLLWSVGPKRLCSVFPKQVVCASRWVGFAEGSSQFPLTVSGFEQPVLGEERLQVLLEADYQHAEALTSQRVLGELCQLERFGVLRAWKAGEFLGVLLESDAEHLTQLGLWFMQTPLCLEDGMELIRIQTVDVSGEPCPLLNADSIPVARSYQPTNIEEEELQEASQSNQEDGSLRAENAACLLMSPLQWRSHVELLQSFSRAAEGAQEVEGARGLVVTSDRTPTLVMKDEEGPPTPPSSPRQSFDTQGSVNDPTIGIPTSAEVPEAKPLSNLTSASDSYYSVASHEMSKLSASLDILDKALSSISDEQANNESPSVNGEPSPLPYVTNITNGTAISVTGSSYSTLSHASSETRPLRGSTVSLPSSTPRSRSPSSPVKYPNVLVLSDSQSAQDNVRLLLKQTLKKYRYTVYSISSEQLKSPTWQSSTALVVVCGSVPDILAAPLLNYLLAGGKLLCLCSDLLHLVLPEFRTAEVRVNELVTFSYQRWTKIKMLHHVFCYQQSPSHSKFGAEQAKSAVTPPSAVELKDREGHPHKLEVTVLGKEETWHTPSLLLGKAPTTGGKVIFSQVHLEVDPLQYETDSATFSSLKQSNVARMEIMRDILGSHLGLECSSVGKEEPPSPAYFLGRFELKNEFLSSVKSRLGPGGHSLGMDNLLLQFCGTGVAPAHPSSTLLPVMLHTCPPHFNTVQYFDTLNSEALGRLVIYADVMSSSMEIFSGPSMWHGIAAVPRQQLKGRGRGSNEWLSPEGCAMFTIQLHFPLSSILGRRISLIQHIAALAVVLAVRENPGYEDVDLRLKWPNDIYAGDWAKMGGLIANSSICGQQVVCNIGCGFNLSNSEPTTCLQDLLKENGSSAVLLSLEKYLALTFNRLETLLRLAQSSEEGLDEVLQLYYAYWLHSGAEVTVQSDDGTSQLVTVQGLDQFGFLSVLGQDGMSFSVHPDGNSFDMLEGLIRPKT